MKTNSIFKLLVMLVAFLFASKAYSQTKYIEVGGTLMLDVPSGKIGHVDKAIWACSNPAISFVSKSNVYAEIKALKSFDGCATIELVYVESYVDNKGFTRAITYTKNFYVYCKGGTSGGGTSKTATSISVEPEMKVALGEKVKIYYHLYPEGSTADVHYNGASTIHQNDGYVDFFARTVGVNDVSLYFYNENDEKVSADCRVTVYDPTWTEPESISIPNDLLLTVGETKKILPVVTPKSATSIYYWSSDNYSVVSFSDEGVVAKKAGMANIKLKTSNGLMAKCTVVVVQDDKQIPGLNKALNRNFSMLQSVEDEVVK